MNTTEQVRHLCALLKEEHAVLSFIKTSSPYYHALIDLGLSAVPDLIRYLSLNGETPWYILTALHDITQEKNLVSDKNRGVNVAVSQAWINWYCQNRKRFEPI